jgi:hypothetical protein
VAVTPELKDWLPVLSDITKIEKVMVYDDQEGRFITLTPESGLNPEFTIQGGEGLIVYALQDKEIAFTTLLYSDLDLRQGLNLVGILECPAKKGAGW